jgi:hypothetical protein
VHLVQGPRDSLAELAMEKQTLTVDILDTLNDPFNG